MFLPVKSVGVMGDGRRYDYVVALRAVETVDFMTARWAHLPYDFLDRVSRRIINEVRGISRVVYDVSGKPPATGPAPRLPGARPPPPLFVRLRDRLLDSGFSRPDPVGFPFVDLIRQPPRDSRRSRGAGRGARQAGPAL